MCGEGDLIRHLESFGLRCAYSGDIRSGQDALGLDHYGAADAIITNPPYTRDLMHRLIEHFQAHRADLAVTGLGLGVNQAGAPYLSCCSDIVAIGRVKWIEGSKHTGKDNHFRFGVRHRGRSVNPPCSRRGRQKQVIGANEQDPGREVCLVVATKPNAAGSARSSGPKGFLCVRR